MTAALRSRAAIPETAWGDAVMGILSAEPFTIVGVFYFIGIRLDF